ncbi:hypothetical protein ACX5K5_16815 (plasmid) [Glutamicibacter bergerei]
MIGDIGGRGQWKLKTARGQWFWLTTRDSGPDRLRQASVAAGGGGFLPNDGDG